MRTEEAFMDWAAEFLASDSASAFRSELRESAGPLLAPFLGAACRRSGGGMDTLEAGHLARALALDVPSLGLPDGARLQFPRLAAAFLAFLQESGRLSGGSALGEGLQSGAIPLADRAPLPVLGRNDPCHCGSGRKYKRCCGT